MKNCLLVFLLALCNLTFAQITFQKTYSGGYGYCVHQTADDGFIVFGTLYPHVTGNTIDLNLIKTNSYGDTLWTKTYGMSDRDVTLSGLETSDGGYLILANIQVPLSVVLIKTDELGDTVWTKRYDLDLANSVQQTNDGGFIITGSKNVIPNSDQAILLKTDSIGTVLWEKSYGYNVKDETGKSVVQTSDSGFIFTGTTEGVSSSSRNIWIIKTDLAGDTLWTREIGNSGIDLSSSILQLLDGNYIVSGYTESGGSVANSFFLMKLDSVGGTLWTKSYSNSDFSEVAIQQTSDSGFIMAGTSAFTPSVNPDVLLIKTNSTGDTLWTRFFGGANYEHAYSVEQTTDGGYIIAGNTQTFASPGNNTNTYLIKTDASGHTDCYENNYLSIPGGYGPTYLKDTMLVAPRSDSALAMNSSLGYGGEPATLCIDLSTKDAINNLSGEIIISPNPTTGKLFINSTTSLSELKIFAMEIYNLFGELVFKNQFEINSDISFLPAGIYVVQLTGEKIYRMKIVKQ